MATTTPTLPGADLDPATMPGHWLLARLGKRVLRPGGIELTRRLLDSLAIRSADDVVEFAPGLGVTAHMALRSHPASYTGIEREEHAAAQVRRLLGSGNRRCLIGAAENTGLPAASASVVFGEAMLTMHGQEQKARIVREAFRVLRPGGRYGIHELGLSPPDASSGLKSDVLRALSETIRVGARPLTVVEWVEVLQAEGFRVQRIATEPMHLLELRRLVSDEGLLRALRFALNVLRDPVARRRVRGMRAVFRHYEANLRAVMLVAIKPADSSP